MRRGGRGRESNFMLRNFMLPPTSGRFYITNETIMYSISRSAHANGIRLQPIALCLRQTPAMSVKWKLSCSPNALRLNFLNICNCAQNPIRAAMPGFSLTLCIASANSSGIGAHRIPVTPSIMLSIGPPLLHAKTGLPTAIASNGTIPKCSSSGVYSTHKHFASKSRFSSELIDGKNTTSLEMPSSNDSR